MADTSRPTPPRPSPPESVAGAPFWAASCSPLAQAAAARAAIADAAIAFRINPFISILLIALFFSFIIRTAIRTPVSRERAR